MHIITRVRSAQVVRLLWAHRYPEMQRRSQPFQRSLWRCARILRRTPHIVWRRKWMCFGKTRKRMSCTWENHCTGCRRTFRAPIDRCGTYWFNATRRTGHSRKSHVEQDVKRHGRCPDGQCAIVSVEDMNVHSSVRQSVHTTSQSFGW